MWSSNHEAPTLPIELCEMVIDYIAADTYAYVPSGLAPQYQLRQRHGDLVACALTCRAWALRSLHHLSSRLLINRRGRLEIMSTLLRDNPARAARVRSLYLCSPPRPYSPEDYDSFSRWSRLVPLRLARVLTTIERLIVVDLDWRNMHQSFLALFGQFTSITILRLHDVHFDNAARLASFLHTFPSLREVVLRSVYLDKHAQKAGRNHKRGSSWAPLDSITIRAMAHITSLLPWLLQYSSSLQSLTLDVTQPTPVLATTLKHLNRLRNLSLDFQLARKDLDEALARLDLSRCEELEHFSLRASQDYLSALPHLLSAVPREQLTQLTLSMCATAIQSILDKDPPSMQAWKDLDAVLSSKFIRLRAVVLTAAGADAFMMEDHDRLARDILPTLHGRDAVIFRKEDEHQPLVGEPRRRMRQEIRV